MANRMFKPLGGSLTQEVVCLTGKWTFEDDAGTPDTLVHEGFTVGVSATGQQIITLNDRYNSLVAVSMTYLDTDLGKGTTEQLVTEDVGGDKTIKVQYLEADGTVQTEGNLEDKSVYCMIWLKNSSV